MPQTCGIQSPQHTAFLPTHSTNAVARSECPPTKRLPLPLALLQRKISAKRGIMKSLEIPNGLSIISMYRERTLTPVLVGLCCSYSTNTTYRSINTRAL